jgi:hypothetical protein
MVSGILSLRMKNKSGFNLSADGSKPDFYVIRNLASQALFLLCGH